MTAPRPTVTSLEILPVYGQSENRSRNDAPALAQAIARHFDMIGRDPRISACVRECAERLVGDWQAYALLGEAASEGRAGGVLH